VQVAQKASGCLWRGDETNFEEIALERWILLLCDWQCQSSNYSKVTLNNKGEGRQFIHEAEDFAVFLPVVY